ncbi:hypothetical protein O181_019649 [Austropuccinia psidii MF-1]|uniref:Uncharacterized protein n=1 Tax=Austropuccinia psidii MF-1 TaxID=1389203 RepID=A0A9Q3GUY1_9BASI|nr:hypothetical protein [Austropuccinia psidii MF-1]
MNVWKWKRIVLNITIPDFQNETTDLLGRSHAAVLGSKLQTSGGICGVRKQRNVARWTNVGRPIPIGGRPIYSSSEVPISRINTEVIVKRIRQSDNSPPDLDAEGNDELDGEEVEMAPNPASHPSNTSPSPPPAKPALNQEVRPSPIQQSRNSPIVTSRKLQPVASTSRRREELSPLPFPAAQVFHGKDQWPMQVTREDSNMASDNQDAVARLFMRVDRNSTEVIMYANDRTIPGTASEEMAERFSWYEDELINDFKKYFDYLGRDN